MGDSGQGYLCWYEGIFSLCNIEMGVQLLSFSLTGILLIWRVLRGPKGFGSCLAKMKVMILSEEGSLSLS
jgi:hypothetical protein